MLAQKEFSSVSVCMQVSSTRKEKLRGLGHDQSHTHLTHFWGSQIYVASHKMLTWQAIGDRCCATRDNWCPNLLEFGDLCRKWMCWRFLNRATLGPPIQGICMHKPGTTGGLTSSILETTLNNRSSVAHNTR